MSDSPVGETMGAEFADGTRPVPLSLTADQIQALRKLERAEKVRQAKLSTSWRDLPEILD